MFLDWRARKQLAYLGVLVLIPLTIGIYFFLRSIPEATCFDNKRNQGEERADCGGPCKPCLENLSEPVVLWTRLFKLAEGVYEVAALIENSHNFAGAERVIYRAKIYDEANILIGLRQGETFINPNEKFLILEPGFVTSERKPARALIEFEPIIWSYSSSVPPRVIVVARDFSMEPQPRLAATLKNEDLFDAEGLQVSAVLLDEKGTAIGASLALVERIEGNGQKTISFSWPSLESAPKTIEIFSRKIPK